MTTKSCSYPDCGRAYVSSGYCRVHYYQFRRTGTVFPIRPRGVPLHVGCRETGCDQPHFARGWCQAHHRQLWIRYAKYGITIEWFEATLKRQGGVCAVCGGTPKVFAVDHDHACCSEQNKSCGKCVRGLVCIKCNTGLGMFNDSPTALRAAADYLDGVVRKAP